MRKWKRFIIFFCVELCLILWGCSNCLLLLLCLLRCGWGRVRLLFLLCDRTVIVRRRIVCWTIPQRIGRRSRSNAYRWCWRWRVLKNTMKSISLSSSDPHCMWFSPSVIASPLWVSWRTPKKEICMLSNLIMTCRRRWWRTGRMIRCCCGWVRWWWNSFATGWHFTVDRCRRWSEHIGIRIGIGCRWTNCSKHGWKLLLLLGRRWRSRKRHLFSFHLIRM